MGTGEGRQGEQEGKEWGRVLPSREDLSLALKPGKQS